MIVLSQSNALNEESGEEEISIKILEESKQEIEDMNQLFHKSRRDQFLDNEIEPGDMNFYNPH